MSSGNSPMQPVQGHKRQHVGGDGHGLRTAIACRACRERKTRCSGHQPACAYCSKAGVSCEYAPNLLTYTPRNATPTFDGWGEKILAAINSLAKDVKYPHQRRDSLGPVNANDDASTAAVFSEHRGETQANSVEEEPSYIPIEGPSTVMSLPSILAWNVFSKEDDVLARFSLLLSEHARQPKASHTSGKETASCARSDLLALTSIFEVRFLPAMSIIDMTELRGYIAHIGEFGLLWNTESCLVLLVAALASMYSHNQDQPFVLHTEPSAVGNTTSSNIEITPGALRYWNMAKKRLAWALEDSGLLAAQCQFLAGIWHIYASEPAAAWKMFNGSVLAIDSVGPRYERGIADVQRTEYESLGETIRWACVSFLCRLRCEEGFSISSSMYKLPNRDMESQFWSHRSDASLLQIRQSTLLEFRTLHADMSVKDICALHTKLAAAERALDGWYERLPTQLRFFTNEEPGIQIEEGEHYRALLQSRYLETKELILRPSIYVLLHVGCLRRRADAYDSNTLQSVLCGYYADQFRSMSLQHRAVILMRLNSCLNSHMEQPLMDAGWFKTRTSLSLALLLLAAERGFDRGVFEETFPLHADCVLLLDTVEEFLRRDHTSGMGRIYASFLHDLREN